MILGHFARSSDEIVRSTQALDLSDQNPTGYVEIQLAPPIGTIQLHGFQYGEKFGHSLCAVDINGDGYDDLVVGAPYHSNNDQVTRSFDFRKL